MARIRGYLGLCARSGQLVMGQEACVDAVRKNRVALILLDDAGSENTRKRLTDACGIHGIPLFGIAEGTIASAVGKEGIKAVGTKSGGITGQLLTLLSNEPAEDLFT